MLVLTRRLGESFWIGDTFVKVVKVGRQVKLGISGPLEIPIVRSELKDKERNDAPRGETTDT